MHISCPSCIGMQAADQVCNSKIGHQKSNYYTNKLAGAQPDCLWRFNRCEDLVSRLMAAYNSPTGIPFNTIALDTLDVRNPTWTRRSSTLSEFGSEQLEFVKLSQLTGNATYGQKAEYVIHLLHSKYPDKVRIASGECQLELKTTAVD